MLLSIIVLSYNRPEQIKRILRSLQSAKAADFNLIIKDDCSPRQIEIKDIVDSFSGKHEFDVFFYKNHLNLGYDANLLDSFNITDSEYIFLLSDDDYIDGEYVGLLIEVLALRKYKLYFTPYVDAGISNRINIKTFNENYFHEVVYNSILFSGLIFDRLAVINLPKDERFLSSCIYTQVYLACMLVFYEKSFGEAPGKLLYLGGDGENYFGKNQAAINQHDLQDRKSMESNLKYQKFLISVVKKISNQTSKKIFNLFEREYNKRIVAYLLRARSLGVNQYRNLCEAMNNTGVDYAWYVKFSMVLINLIPNFIAFKVYRLSVIFLKKSG